MNKKAILNIFILCVMALPSFAEGKLDFDLTQKKILHNIAQELKMIKSVRRLSINLEHRLFELYSERNKIIFEAENKSYIKKAKFGKKKLSYFPISYKNYKYIHKLGLLITIKNPYYYSNDEIYYKLSQISHDFHGDKYTKLYLKKALKITKKKELRYKIEKDLAEYYFNKKKFKTAGYYFKKAIEYNTPWTTKHLFNLAWCQHMRKKFDLSLSTLMKSYETSNKKGYVNINDQIFKTGVVFFDMANKIPDAIEFYVQNSKKPIDYLLKLAKRTNKKGLWDGSYQVIEKINTLISHKRDMKEYINAKHFELSTYNEFKKYNLFYNLTQEFKALAIKKEVNAFSDDIILLIEHRNEYLQKILVATYKQNESINYTTSERISTYFETLKIINPSRKCAYEYHQGENLFFVQQYLKAIKNYKQAISYCTEQQNREYLLKDVNSLLGTIALIKGSQKASYTNPLLILGYTTYIKNWPKSSKSQDYLEQMFKIYNSEKNIAFMNKTLNEYLKRYPKATDQIKPMILVITDSYIKNSDQKNISRVLNYINSNKIPFSTAKIQSITTALGNIVFKSLENSNQDDLEKGLKQIHKSPIYPQKIKMESALKLALFYADNNKHQNYRIWVSEFNKIATNKQFKKYRSAIFSSFHKLYLTGNYNILISVTKDLSSRCVLFEQQHKDSIVTMIKDSHLMSKNFNITLANYGNKLLTKECTPSNQLVEQSKVDFYSKYLFQKDIKTALAWANEISKDEVDSLFTHYTDMYWTQTLQGETAHLLLKTISLFEGSISLKKFTKFHTQKDTFNRLIAHAKTSDKIKFTVPTPFDEKVFNSNLEGFLLKVGQLADQIQSEISSLPPAASIVILDNLTQLYFQKAQELRTAPLTGLEKHYHASISQVLKQLSNALLKKYHYLTNSKNRAIRGQKIADIANLVINNYDISLTPLTKKTIVYLGYDKIKKGGK